LDNIYSRKKDYEKAYIYSNKVAELMKERMDERRQKEEGKYE